MSATIHKTAGFGRTATGERGPLRFQARFTAGGAASGTCGTCGGDTRRSRYGILHEDCFGCRYLKMIYGDSIRVTRAESRRKAS
jgi:hypothetical protein